MVQPGVGGSLIPISASVTLRKEAAIVSHIIELSIFTVFYSKFRSEKRIVMDNYLPKNSKTQYRKQTRHLLIIVNKESPTFRWGSLQLTTYETQSSLWCGAAVLSPSPCPERTDMVLTPRSGDLFKIFSDRWRKFHVSAFSNRVCGGRPAPLPPAQCGGPWKPAER